MTTNRAKKKSDAASRWLYNAVDWSWPVDKSVKPHWTDDSGYSLNPEYLRLPHSSYGPYNMDWREPNPRQSWAKEVHASNPSGRGFAGLSEKQHEHHEEAENLIGMRRRNDYFSPADGPRRYETPEFMMDYSPSSLSGAGGRPIEDEQGMPLEPAAAKKVFSR